MGRQKGTVELALEPAQTKQACDHMKKIMPDKVSGALQVAPEKIFNEYACKSAQPQIDRVYDNGFFCPSFEAQCMLPHDLEQQNLLLQEFEPKARPSQKSASMILCGL